MAESSSCYSEHSPSDNYQNKPTNIISQLADTSSIGSFCDLFGESRREGNSIDHYTFGGGLFSSFVFVNRANAISTLNQNQHLRLHSISEVLFKPSKNGIYHFCHFSVRVNLPDRAMVYVRKYVHKMVGNGKYIQIVLHENEHVNPHFHVIHCGKSSPPRTNAMRHFLQYYCAPFRPVIHGQHEFTSPIAAAYRHHLIQLYVVGGTGYEPVVFKIAPPGSTPVVHSGYNLFSSSTVDEELRKSEADTEETTGCTAAHPKGGIHQIRKRPGTVELGLDGASSNQIHHGNETQPEQDPVEERRATFVRALQEKKSAILMAPTPLQLASLCIELYVSSIETLENFKPWTSKFIKLALKDQRHRESVFQSTEVIVDLQTKNWTFEDIGMNVFAHNNFFPNNPVWFSSSGTPIDDFYNLCTSTMLYITSVAQNNLIPPKLDYCQALVPTNISNAYNYIFWTQDFLNLKHESKKMFLLSMVPLL